jgi:hypothetical protein
MFKNFLRLEARADEITITCFVATGCLPQEQEPPIEDAIRATPTSDGRWSWTVTMPS